MAHSAGGKPPLLDGLNILLMQETHLSVALVTRNRAASLERTLKSLRSQEVQPWEIIVSDDSDVDQAAEVSRVAVAYGCQYMPGPHRGLYANRNQVALSCRGTHIRSMDDDHEFPANHMAECLRAIECDRAAVWIIGEYLPGEMVQGAPPQCPGQLHPRGFSVAPLNPDDSWALSDGATIYPRDVFSRGLRFAEAFPFGAAYLEFGSRLHFFGYRIRQIPSTYVVHYHDLSKRSIVDPEQELAAEFFAMLCHSFIYQPRLKNRLMSLLQIAWVIAQRGGSAIRSLRTALREYRTQARVIEEQRARFSLG